MSFSDELQHTLQTMGFVQLLLALVFLGGYVLALSGFTGPRGRRRAAVIALLAALGFAAATPDWATGALMMVLAVGGVGLFVVLVWSLDRLMAARSRPEPGPADPAEATPAAMWDSAAEPTSAEPSHEPTHAAHRPQQQHASP